MSTKWEMGVEKLFENDDFLIVNKPFDMYINSDDENEKNTVTYHIASPDSHLSTSPNPIHFIQRLDYSTSGVLCLAKNKVAAARAGKLFEKRHTGKYYLAVVRGNVAFELADIEYDVGMDALTADSSHRMSALVNSLSDPTCVHSRRAHTRMLVLETGRYGDENVTVVLLKPITGRRHQLRVHCQSVGHTILGDYTYSNASDITPHRMFLHATRLILPLSTDPIDVQTGDPFFTDPRFTQKWRSDKCFYKYRSKEDFRHACDIIDQSYVIGVQYKRFKYSN